MAGKARKAEPARKTGTSIRLSSAIESWVTALEARNLSDKTIKSYLDSMSAFTRWLHEEGTADIRIEKIDATLLRRFQAHQVATKAATTARSRHVALKILLGWLVDEGELDENPMDLVERPIVPEKIPDLIPEGEIKALLKSFDRKGKTPDGEYRRRRDHAIVVLYLNTGCRLSEIANLKLEDIDPKARSIRVVRKGRREQDIGYGPGVGVILDRYLRIRREHRAARDPWLWLGKQGRFTSVGIGQMLGKRGAEAGIDKSHAHAYRNSWTADRMRRGLSDSYLQELGGWRSPAMLQRYGKAVRAEHAREANSELPEIV